MKTVRCAIYTRKSSEEGLAQEFNSLDAQREACVAFIASQKHEGWVLVPDHYDDGGISGGTLERPGLKRLMQHLDEGRIDQIVVYKIDRLTRSLADFAKLVERLEGAGASFVSVTQSFNTATSMGRLTLNVLLSFAQFEREVTAERIRDKLAASKQKGMWMGGTVPLGYAKDERSLKIVEDEADTVRTIYRLYEEHGSLVDVREEADRLGLRSRPRKSGGNDAAEKVPAKLGITNIHYILTNPTYAGKIRHRDRIHPGHHPAIVDEATWQRVQERLRESGAFERGARGRPATCSPLAGKLFDDQGDRFTPSHGQKKGLRYRYYISSRLIHAAKGNGKGSAEGTGAGANAGIGTGAGAATGRTDRGWRLPASALEEELSDAVLNSLTSAMPDLLNDRATADEIARVDEALKAQKSLDKTMRLSAVLATIDRVDIQQGRMDIALDSGATAALLSIAPQQINPRHLRFAVPFRYRKRGVETRLVIGHSSSQKFDQTLIRNIARAHSIYAGLKRGQSFAEIARSENLSTRRVMQIVELAFLAPSIVKQVLSGDQPEGLTTKWLATHSLPSDWREQQRIVSRL